jgi:hypothetical protein
MGVSRVALACVLPLAACAADTAPPHEIDVGAVSAALRPDDAETRGEPSAFAADDRVEHFDSRSGFFRVHFTRGGVHGVPLDDADGDGTPDYVARVAIEYDAVLAFFRDTLGFAEPLRDGDVASNGGDDRFDVYLVDFPTSSDGAYRQDACGGRPRRCTGYMLQENDFNDRGYASLADATRVLASHELFHAVQNAYDADAGVVLGEGTAVWASEAFDGHLGDFESLIRGYFAHPERSLGQEPSGPVDAFSYGSAIFFRFLEERYDRALIRDLWQALGDAGGGADAGVGGDAPAWPALLDRLLARDGSSMAEAFAEFARWNLYTGMRADPDAAYADGADYPALTEKVVELPFDDELRVFPLSARYFAGRARDAGSLRVELVAEDNADLDGLVLVLARESHGPTLDVATADAADEAGVTLDDVQSGERVHAAVINTRLDGASAQPALCFGSVDDVAKCRAAIAPAQAQDDAGVPPAAKHDSGGCSAGAPRGGTPGGLGWTALAALAMALRVRGRRARCGSARRAAASTR